MDSGISAKQLKPQTLLTRSPEWTVAERPVMEAESFGLALCLCSSNESIRWVGGRLILDLLPPEATETAAGLLTRWINRRLLRQQSLHER